MKCDIVEGQMGVASFLVNFFKARGVDFMACVALLDMLIVGRYSR